MPEQRKIIDAAERFTGRRMDIEQIDQELVTDPLNVFIVSRLRSKFLTAEEISSAASLTNLHKAFNQEQIDNIILQIIKDVPIAIADLFNFNNLTWSSEILYLNGAVWRPSTRFVIFERTNPFLGDELTEALGGYAPTKPIPFRFVGETVHSPITKLFTDVFLVDHFDLPPNIKDNLTKNPEESRLLINLMTELYSLIDDNAADIYIEAVMTKIRRLLRRNIKPNPNLLPEQPQIVEETRLIGKRVSWTLK
jgi:hypothetical protein